VLSGKPHRQEHLVRAGVHKCAVFMGCGYEACETQESDTLISYVGFNAVVKEKDNVNLKNFIFEFHQIDSIRLLHRQKSTAEAEEHGAPQQDILSAVFDPHYASGRVFAPQVLSALLAQVYHVPGLLQIVRCFALPEEQAVIGTNAESDADDQKEEENEQVFNIPWLIQLPPDDVGNKYGDLLSSFIKDPVYPVLPIGLYRKCFEASRTRGNLGFVWTNPSKDVVLQQTDQVYVLGSAGFGRWAARQGLLATGPAGGGPPPPQAPPAAASGGQ